MDFLNLAYNCITNFTSTSMLFNTFMNYKTRKLKDAIIKLKEYITYKIAKLKW